MDWQDKEQTSPRETWQYALCAFVVLCLTAALVSYSIGSPDNTEEIPVSSQSSNQVFIPVEKDGVATSLELPPAFHPWGAFEPGAWCLSRTTVGGRRLGRISSKTYMESNVILQDKRNNHFTTLTESTVLLAGKNIQKEPKTTQTDFFGLSITENSQIKELPSETLTIEGVPVVCRVLKIISTSAHNYRETRIWINETTAPYIFRKERSTFRLPSRGCSERLQLNVTSINQQFSLAGKVMTGFRYTQTANYLTYNSFSEVVASLAVPGRIVTQVTRETDHRGHLLHDISMELLDFGLTPEEHQCNVCSSSARSSRLIIMPARQETDEESSAQTESGLEDTSGETGNSEDSDLSEILEKNSFTNGKHSISVEFSIQNKPETSLEVKKQEAEKPDEKPPLEPESVLGPKPESVPESPEKDPTQMDVSVNPEDFANPFRLAAFSQTLQDSEAGITPLHNGTVRMEPGLFRQFQDCWQIGKDLLTPNRHIEIGRIFPHLSVASWRNFLLRRGPLSSVLSKRFQRAEETQQTNPEDF